MKEKKKIIKWAEVLACEEMIGLPVQYMPRGVVEKVIGKVIDVEPGIVTAEIDEEMWKKIYKPHFQCVMGVRVDYDRNRKRKSKTE